MIKDYKKYCRPILADLLQKVRMDKIYHRAKGDYMYYYDEKGEEIQIVDFLGGYGANLFGHNCDEIVAKAIEGFSNQLPFNAQASCRGKAALVGKKLNDMFKERTGKEYIVTFANSGTEAIEAAIKHAEMALKNKLDEINFKNSKQIKIIEKKMIEEELKFENKINSIETFLCKEFRSDNVISILKEILEYNDTIFKTSPLFIALERAFHGKTTASVKLSYNKSYRTPFERIGIDVNFLKNSEPQDLDKIINNNLIKYIEISNHGKKVNIEERTIPNISAFFIEPLQGEGGIHPITIDVIKNIRDLTKLYNIPLVFDEIQCGMGRTGTFLFSEQLGVISDYYVLSKSLGGGISKTSALLIDKDSYNNEFGFIHTSTFAEDEHSCSIASKVLEILDRDDEVYNNCKNRGQFLIDGLNKIRKKYPEIIKEVRGRGLMLGIEFTKLNNINAITFKIMSQQNLLGYIISGYLLHEHRIRVAPTLSSNATIRLEPSAYINQLDCERLLFAVERLCETLLKENIYELLKFLVKKDIYGTYNIIEDYRTDIVNFEEINQNCVNVGFLGHLIKSEHLKLMDPGYNNFSDSDLNEIIYLFFDIIEPQITNTRLVRAKNGEMVNLLFIGLFVNSKIISECMKNRKINLIFEKIEKAVQIAKNANCKIMGFGAYTSIVANNCKKIRDSDIAVTTGNSLTVAMGVEAILKKANENGINIEEAVFGAVGAGGNIASVYCEIMAEKVSQIILIGREGGLDKLKQVKQKIYLNAFSQIRDFYFNNVNCISGVAKKIYNIEVIRDYIDKDINYLFGDYDTIITKIESELEEKKPVIISDNYSELKKTNLILGASNSPTPIISSDMIGENEIVICDIAVPSDVDNSVYEKCKNVQVISGGIVELTGNKDFYLNGFPLEKGEAYACLTETLVLGFSRRFEDFSVGNVQKTKVNEILDMCKNQGFCLGKMKTENSY